jgi:hypothetical protein
VRVTEGIKTALITGGFMLGVVIVNEFAAIFREWRNRKKDFFNQFFSERIKAHEEILRAITKDGIKNIEPLVDGFDVVMKKVKTISNAAVDSIFRCSLFADKYVVDALADLANKGWKIGELAKNDGKLDSECEFSEKAAFFYEDYLKVLGMLRKKSGVQLIEDVFESLPQKRAGGKKNDPKDKSGKNSGIRGNK